MGFFLNSKNLGEIPLGQTEGARCPFQSSKMSGVIFLFTLDYIKSVQSSTSSLSKHCSNNARSSTWILLRSVYPQPSPWISCTFSYLFMPPSCVLFGLPLFKGPQPAFKNFFSLVPLLACVEHVQTISNKSLLIYYLLMLPLIYALLARWILFFFKWWYISDAVGRACQVSTMSGSTGFLIQAYCFGIILTSGYPYFIAKHGNDSLEYNALPSLESMP